MNLDLRGTVNIQPIKKFIEKIGKIMFLECLTQKSIPNFVLPTKWAEIFGQTPKDAGDMRPNMSPGKICGRQDDDDDNDDEDIRKQQRN
jgi:hypothetical protein